MCGRFTLKSDEQEIRREFNAATETIEFALARYDGDGRTDLAIVRRENGQSR